MAPFHYREEIYHPAIADPVIARGWFELSDDGSLIRHQTAPKSEISKIGRRFISLRREVDDYENNIVPIPSELAPLLTALRGIILGDNTVVRDGYSFHIDSGDTGWSLALTPHPPTDGAEQLIMSGCGDVLSAIEIRLRNNERRRIIFEKTP